MNKTNDMIKQHKWGQPVRPEDVEPWEWYEVQWSKGAPFEFAWALSDGFLISITYGRPLPPRMAHSIRTARQPGGSWPEVKPDPLDLETWPTAEEAFPDVDLTEDWPSAEGVLAWMNKGKWHYGILSEADEVKPQDRILILKP